MKHGGISGVTGFGLKIAAIIGMTCNHVAHAFGSLMPGWLDFALYSVGGITFPVMAYLLVEGFHYTRDVRRYALRLAAFAVVAQVPYSLLWGPRGNVLFTLLLGLGVLVVGQRFGRGAGAGALVGAVCLSLPLDWNVMGPIIVWMFFVLRKAPGRPGVRCVLLTMAVPFAVMVAEAALSLSVNDLGFACVGFPIAAALLCSYNGRRGRPMKWLFYAYYPLHLFVIWAMLVAVL